MEKAERSHRTAFFISKIQSLEFHIDGKGKVTSDLRHVR